MKLYHATTSRRAALILRAGFRNHTTWQEPQFGPGVWFSDSSFVDEGEGAKGNTVIELSIPKRVALRYALRLEIDGEWVPNGQYLVPAEVANGYPRLLREEGQ